MHISPNCTQVVDDSDAGESDEDEGDEGDEPDLLSTDEGHVDNVIHSHSWCLQIRCRMNAEAAELSEDEDDDDEPAAREVSLGITYHTRVTASRTLCSVMCVFRGKMERSGAGRGG